LTGGGLTVAADGIIAINKALAKARPPAPAAKEQGQDAPVGEKRRLAIDRTFLFGAKRYQVPAEYGPLGFGDYFWVLAIDENHVRVRALNHAADDTCICTPAKM
jgi:hypothetical protein